MLANSRSVKGRYISFCFGCLVVIGILQALFSKLVDWVPSFSPLLFPTLTIFLLVFHLFIACFMAMKYWCDKRRLYLIAISFAFAGSALLMVGTLTSFPAWLDLYQFNVVNYNDAMIYYMFRHLLMAVLMIVSALLYPTRNLPLSRLAHIIIVSGSFLFTACMVILAWMYSSHSPFLSLDLVDNETRQFMVLWSHSINISLIVLWVVTLATLMFITRVRNLFWVGGNFLCVCYVVTLSMLLVGGHAEDISWYRARLFETVATLIIIFVLLYDVFRLYRDSHLKYQQSYQNSIRDPLTRLYNRSYFYESLNQALGTAKPSRPVSVIVSDLDRFKRINDNYGHLQGDKVLQFVANLLMDSVRPQDIAARIGGEEFVLMLANTSAEDAYQVAERIRLKLSGFDKISSEGQLPEPITISMGVFTATSSSVSAEACVESADKAMYEAKETGRNRVVVFK
ncbi:GGDEF domain-containing protein [Enterobacter bugandensis]|uniref:sensor domain-containing diguanylate cyclase n=1 Tax=Enterobacter TaxID=547 RepID=UPI000F82A652|nr:MULTISPECIES: GGDEF domain-containing protein [Enterobacter]ELF8870597.1 GGDEF domain-containing protein [Enterobacter bugandensis]ELQ3993340.1 GGDEF domain-containing protein [Enterobacter bugandensis]ELV3037897.1 GGDEF domain-containing protein [Enterobacter bugandensis]ELX8411484.1 GGDEF domain-containing protein [Enterobacter bugandensis]MBT1785624.1 GGDEF domain-containing protein [Enterobacter bugandensis]